MMTMMVKKTKIVLKLLQVSNVSP